MSRLTKYQIEQTAKRLLKHRYSAAVLDLRCREAAQFIKVWADLYTAGERELLLGAPEGFFSTAHWLQISIGGQRHQLYAQGGDYGAFSLALSNGDREKLELLPGTARVAYKHHNGFTNLTYDATAPGLPAEIVAQAGEAAALTKTISEAQKRAEATLTQLGTRAKALSEWPEIEPFLPKVEVVRLPAIPVADLNAMFELP